MSASQEKKLVLVIEDDEDIRMLLQASLEFGGYDVLLAANAREGLERLRHAHPQPNLILLDLMMPVMNGWQFRDAQRSDPSIADVPVVIVTASRDTEARSAALGAAGVLHKPVELHSLLAVIGRCCA